MPDRHPMYEPSKNAVKPETDHKIAVILPNMPGETVIVHQLAERQNDGEYTIRATVEDLRRLLSDNPGYCLGASPGRPELMLLAISGFRKEGAW